MAIGHAWVAHTLQTPPGTMLFCAAESVAEAVTAPARAMRVPGVEHAEIIIAMDGAVARDRIAGWCRDEGERMATLRAQRPPAATE